MFCSDLFLTDAFLIKGNVEHKYTRLSKLLDEHRKTFLRVRDCTLIDLGSRDQIHTPLLHMNVDEVLVAHEFLDEAGDNAMADLAKDVLPFREMNDLRILMIRDDRPKEAIVGTHKDMIVRLDSLGANLLAGVVIETKVTARDVG